MGNNINIPYSGYIPNGAVVGTSVIISGVPHHDCKRFSINLCAGPTFDSDTAVTFNPRFDDGRVVRNHRQSGSWGVEETGGGLPFRRGEPFNFELKVEQQGFRFTVNNKHFGNFRHRIPKERVSYLYIEGGVTITYIQFPGQGGVSSPYPTGKILPPAYPREPSPPPAYPGGASYCGPLSYPSHPSPVSGPIYNPPVPLMTPIQGGLHPGRIIYITGIPNHNPSRFTVHLACGSHDSADYGFTFDARFKFGDSHNVVVRTHRQGGKWGPEERHQNYFPFFAGASFEMMILAEHNCFKIAVNNQHFTEFYHRLQPLQRMDYLNIVGDVRLTQIRFQ